MEDERRIRVDMPYLPPPAVSISDYSEIPKPEEADGFILFSTSDKEEYNCCEKHVTYFGDNLSWRRAVWGEGGR